MVKIAQKKECCGCGACAQACGKKCITMCPDEEGFLYPVVDTKSCVQCGACEKVCPMRHKPDSTASVQITAYAAYAKDGHIRKMSSSGGIFPLMAEWVVRNQGVVFGTAFAEDFSVHHIMVQDVEKLPLLWGSKYVQSRIEDTYREARSVLESGRIVLFSGVACQIAGLKAFLGKEYDKLYTVDVLCHGVPSPMIWQKYLNELQDYYGAQATDISFRSKVWGWRAYAMELTFQNGSHFRQTHSRDVFMRCFLHDICLRPSCHHCRFKGIPRSSDLTIGDAWGVRAHMPEMDDDQGTSVVLVNTEQGQSLWDELRSEMIVRQGEVGLLLPSGTDSRKPVRAHPNRKRFFAAANRGADMTQLYRLSQRTRIQRLKIYVKGLLKRVTG